VYDIRNSFGDYIQDCAICARLSVDIPAGGQMTRFRVAATDTTNGPEGEGFCGSDNALCPPLPFTSFGSKNEEALPDGTKRISVQFKNWRNDLDRRGVFAVWFTAPKNGILTPPKK